MQILILISLIILSIGLGLSIRELFILRTKNKEERSRLESIGIFEDEIQKKKFLLSQMENGKTNYVKTPYDLGATGRSISDRIKDSQAANPSLPR